MNALLKHALAHRMQEIEFMPSPCRRQDAAIIREMTSKGRILVCRSKSAQEGDYMLVDPNYADKTTVAHILEIMEFLKK